MMQSKILLVATTLVPSVIVGTRCTGSSETCTRASVPEGRESVLLQSSIRAAADKDEVDFPELPHEWAVGPEPQPAVANLSSSWASLMQETDLMFVGASPTSKELEHYRNVKAERAKGWRCPDGTYYPPNNGEFEWDCRLWRAAKGWSQRMGTENFAGHTHQGSTSCQRTNAQGFPRDRGCGENLALGLSTSMDAIRELKKSKEHCKNFFDPSYNKFGSGYFYNPSAQFKHYWTDAFGAWHQGPDQSCIGGSPAPSPAPGCADIDTFNCQHYKNQGLCSVSPNVQAQCKDTCGIGNCGGSYPAPAPAPAPVPPPAQNGGACQDTTGSCDYYRDQGFCSNNQNVQTHCKKTCGLCGGGGGGSCQDTVGSCDYYAGLGYCSNNDNVRTHCKRTCGLC